MKSLYTSYLKPIISVFIFPMPSSEVVHPFSLNAYSDLEAWLLRERKEPKDGGCCVLLPLGRNGFPAASLFLQASLTTTLERSMGGSLGFSGAGAGGAGAGAVSGTLLLPARNPGFGPAGLAAGLAGGATGRFTGKSFLGAMLLGGLLARAEGRHGQQQEQHV